MEDRFTNREERQIQSINKLKDRKTETTLKNVNNRKNRKSIYKLNELKTERQTENKHMKKTLSK